MLNKLGLYSLLELELSPESPCVTIYSEKTTERLSYTCGFIFHHVLRMPFRLVTSLQEFSDAKGPKINYSRESSEQGIQVIPAGLLFETGIASSKPDRLVTNGMVYFYGQQEGALKYDLFSAVFYFICRYEEWQDFTPDQHGRFEATASLLFKDNFQLKPVVDVWIMELADALLKADPGLRLPEREFRVISTIDVDNLYAYQAKGSLRTLGASAKDLLKMDLDNLKERMRVLSGKKKDPFDIYESVSDFCFERQIPLFYFFLFKTGTAHDRTVDPDSDAFPKVFKTISENHAIIGLHPSYNSSLQPGLLKTEKDKLSQRSGQPITFSRQHYLRFNIRTTPALLIRNGIEADFTMGYASAAGFRAGTSHPFPYYDLEREQATPLLFVPFCVMDGAYTIYGQTDPESAYKEMIALAKEVKQTQGLFISVFHERSFSDHLYKGFGTLYKNLHAHIKAL